MKIILVENWKQNYYDYYLGKIQAFFFLEI